MKREPLEQRCVRAASAIAEELCRDAYWSGDRCNWVGRSPLEAVDLRAPLTPTVSALGPDLYGGTAGVALFLAHVHLATGDTRARAAAEGGIRQALSRAPQIEPAARLGLYSGAIGVAYAAARIGSLLDDDSLLASARAAAESAIETVPDEHPLDMVGGAAGAVCGLLAMSELCGDGRLVEEAIRLGERLVAAATTEGEKWSWDPARATGAAVSARALTGFAHGAAGMGLALLELYARTGRQAFLDGGLGAFAYEDGWFSPEEENWADVRTQDPPFAPAGASGDEGAPGYMTAWCYGAPGIGLSRLRALALLPDERGTLAPRVEAAVRHTVRQLDSRQQSAGADATLCHGTAGLIELLVAAAEVLGDEAAREAAARAWDRAFDQRRETGAWRTGVASGAHTPALMLGSAGIGYSLLRFRDPRAVPSVLLITGAGQGRGAGASPDPRRPD
jgi:lantibiotic modifying enzyme